MEKIEMIHFLAQDAGREIEKIEAYSKALESGERERIWNTPQLNRQRIKDDMKMLRRLSLEVEREVNR